MTDWCKNRRIKSSRINGSNLGNAAGLGSLDTVDGILRRSPGWVGLLPENRLPQAGARFLILVPGSPVAVGPGAAGPLRWCRDDAKLEPELAVAKRAQARAHTLGSESTFVFDDALKRPFSFSRRARAFRTAITAAALQNDRPNGPDGGGAGGAGGQPARWPRFVHTDKQGPGAWRGERSTDPAPHPAAPWTNARRCNQTCVANGTHILSCLVAAQLPSPRVSSLSATERTTNIRAKIDHLKAQN
jgi:hypothetical protein